MGNQKMLSLLAMEDRLAGDQDKKELNGLLATLDGYLADVGKTLDAGLPPEEFRAMSKYRQALEEAKIVAERAWLFLCVK